MSAVVPSNILKELREGRIVAGHRANTGREEDLEMDRIWIGVLVSTLTWCVTLGKFFFFS